jgi:hypothetical protein
LKAQPVAQLRLGLRVAQAVEVLEQHHPQKHRRAVARPAQFAVSRLQPPFGLGKIDQRRDLFQHFIGPRALRQCPILKTDLLVFRCLHPLSTRFPTSLFNHFAEVSERAWHEVDVFPGRCPGLGLNRPVGAKTANEIIRTDR